MAFSFSSATFFALSDVLGLLIALQWLVLVGHLPLLFSFPFFSFFFNPIHPSITSEKGKESE
jgi:hypothetical protein